MRITQLPNGNLLLQASNEDRHEIAERRRAGHSHDHIMAELLEPYSTNGRYTPFNAGNGNPHVGLTSAPCIAESMDTDDNGHHEVTGKLWWFPAYELRDELEELRTKGRVVFFLAA